MRFGQHRIPGHAEDGGDNVARTIGRGDEAVRLKIEAPVKVYTWLRTVAVTPESG